MDRKEVLEKQIKILEEAQEKCKKNGAYDQITPFSKMITEIIILLQNL